MVVDRTSISWGEAGPTYGDLTGLSKKTAHASDYPVRSLFNGNKGGGTESRRPNRGTKAFHFANHPRNRLRLGGAEVMGQKVTSSQGSGSLFLKKRRIMTTVRTRSG